jgi:phosphoribosylglycinamide formyltransferase 1
MRPLSVGVLVSGSGSNLQAILDTAQGDFPARVSLVISNIPGVRALERAEKAGVRAEVMPHQDYPTRAAFEQAMANTLEAAGVELVITAGFMRLLTPVFLQRFPARVINLHPSLLPAFPGTHALEQALAYGARVTGCTVHFVDAGMDTGPIILQGVVPIEQSDTAETLHQRVQRQEHSLLPEAIRLFALQKLKIEGRRVLIAE